MKNHGGMLTQLLLSHLLFALTIYQINAISLIFTQWSDMQINYICLNFIWKH